MIATRPATAPEMPPSTLGLPLRIHSASIQPSAAAAAPKCVATKALVASADARQRAAGVESEPAHPQQAGADEAQHQVVRLHRLARIALPLAQIQRADQRRDARGDVHHRAAREIEARESCRRGRRSASPPLPHTMCAIGK